MSNIDFQNRQDRLENFSSELSKLLTKYGVSLNVCGGVYVYSEDELKEMNLKNRCIIVNNPDASSCDLSTLEVIRG